MAVTDQQKLDFLLKKIGYTKTKTGSVVGTGAISGTPKQPFAEAIPSPLVVPNSSLWNEAGAIPTTPPSSDTPQVKVYLAATSGLRMTADATSSGQRAYIAYSTYGNTSSTRLTNWIDTQFGASYIIKVYRGDPNSGGVNLSAAGSGNNDGWFFDYSAGVLNFNDTNVPSGVTDINIYIVGYRYIGQTGAPTSGISTFSHLDLTVERNLDVGKQGGISTFRHNVQLLDNDKLQFGDSQDLEIYHDSNHSYIDDTGTGNLKIRSGTIEVSNLAGSKTSAVFNSGSSQDLYFNNQKRFETTNTGINVIGDGVFSGNVSIGGTLTYEDVKNVDAVGLITARSGIRVTGGVIEAQAGENKIPSLYSNMAALPSAGSYHGMFAHVHATGRGYFAHAGAWLELVNKELNGVVGTGTENYNVGVITASSFSGDGDFFDLDVDGHTELDNVNIVGIVTVTNTSSGTALKLVDSSNKQFAAGGGGGGSPFAGSLTNHDFRIQVGGTQNAIFKYGAGATGNLELGPASGIGITFNGATGNVQIAGITTFASSIYVADSIIHKGDTDTKIEFATNQIKLISGNKLKIDLTSNGFTYIRGTGISEATSTYPKQSGSTYVHRFRDTTGDDTEVQFFNTNAKNTILSWNDYGNSTTAGNLVFKGVAGGSGAEHARFTGSGNFNLLRDLDVDGHTNLDNVSIAGVTSVASLTSGRVVTVGTGGKLEDSANLTFDGNDLYVRGINIIGGGATSVLGADIVTRNFKATGVSTFVGAAQFDSGIKAGGSTGNNGEYLQSTGSGLTWSSFPSLRTRQTFTASSGQTTFSFAYTVGFLDVYVNGIKLTDAEFTATNGTTTVLAVGCFVGDIVELVAYNTVSASGGAFGIGNLVEDLSPQLGGNLDLNNKLIIGTGGVNITGVITATSFSGTVPSSSLSGALPALDGSALTGITASGSGVIIKHDGNTVGTAGTINFSTNLDVSPISAGIVTITASGGGGGGGVSGINTIGGVVNIANDLDVDGHTNLDNVSIAGVVTATTIKSSNVDIDGGSIDNTNIGFFTPANAVFGNVTINQLHTVNGAIDLNGDLDVDGHTNLDNVSIAGVVTATDLDIDGHTNLDNVSIAGVTTFTGAINVSDIRSDSITLKNAAGGSSYATFTNSDGKAVLNWNNTKRLETDVNGVNIVGILSATILAGDGSGITNLPVGGHYVQDEGNVLSAAPATVVNYVGAGVSATQSGSIATVTIPGATGNMAFTKIAVAGQSDVDADSSTDTLTLVGGSNMTITTNASNDTITFQAAGGGGGSGVDVGITTNLTGSFTAAGSAATINTYAYSSIDRVFEYTVLIEQGPNFQTSKVLAKRSGSTINAVQYAVMHNSNLLAQLDVIISSGEVRLIATPEPGVTGTTGYRIKREVM